MRWRISPVISASLVGSGVTCAVAVDGAATEGAAGVVEPLEACVVDPTDCPGVICADPAAGAWVAGVVPAVLEPTPVAPEIVAPEAEAPAVDEDTPPVPAPAPPDWAFTGKTNAAVIAAAERKRQTERDPKATTIRNLHASGPRTRPNADPMIPNTLFGFFSGENESRSAAP